MRGLAGMIVGTAGTYEHGRDKLDSAVMDGVGIPGGTKARNV